MLLIAIWVVVEKVRTITTTAAVAKTQVIYGITRNT